MKSLDFGPQSIQECPLAGFWREEGRGDRLPTLRQPFLPPGEILVQMSDTQRHLNSDLEVVVSIGPWARITQTVRDQGSVSGRQEQVESCLLGKHRA